MYKVKFCIIKEYLYKNNNKIEALAHKLNKNPFIFTKKTNSNYKLVPFNLITNYVGGTKYLPPVAKEWKDSVYQYNSSNMINLPVNNLNINELIKGYFSLYFNHKFYGRKFLSGKSKRKSLNKIFVSKAEIKHTNDKAVITLYVYNRERLVLQKKMRNLLKISQFKTIRSLKNKFNNFISSILTEDLKGKFESNSKLNKIIFLLKHKINSKLRFSNKKYYAYTINFHKRAKKLFSIIRKLRLRFNLNKFKFEEKFLYKLSEMISEHYGKKVEFNIVNLKSIAYNSDIFVEILTTKVKREQSSPTRRMDALLSKINVAKDDVARSKFEKSVDYDLLENKYGILNINNVINKENKTYSDTSYKDNLNKLLYNLYYKKVKNSSNNIDLSVLDLKHCTQNYYKKLREIIFENISYKTIAGARLTVKGRLTKRYRADRAMYSLKWKGGLKNIHSSFRGLSTVVFRGYLDSNVEKSMQASKRRIGSFAVQGWISTK